MYRDERPDISISCCLFGVVRPWPGRLASFPSESGLTGPSDQSAESPVSGTCPVLRRGRGAADGTGEGHGRGIGSGGRLGPGDCTVYVDYRPVNVVNEYGS